MLHFTQSTRAYNDGEPARSTPDASSRRLPGREDVKCWHNLFSIENINLFHSKRYDLCFLWDIEEDIVGTQVQSSFKGSLRAVSAPTRLLRSVAPACLYRSDTGLRGLPLRLYLVQRLV